MLLKIWNFFKGKKTFIIASLMVILGYLTGNNDMILQGLGFIGLRFAIK
jgi:hypothetical protein